MICLSNVEKSFKSRAGFTCVLRQISLNIEEGEFITLMGPSRAGKSTLLNILGLYDRDFEGEYLFDETAVHKLNVKERQALNRQHIGFVFQQFDLLDDMTVAENLELPLNYRNLERSERQARVADTLDRFGIVTKKDLFPAQLSGGRQQLVAICPGTHLKPFPDTGGRTYRKPAHRSG